jgi:hypothetical protein
MAGNNKFLGRRTWIVVTIIVLAIIVIPLVIYFAADIEKNELNDITRTEIGTSFIRLPGGVTHYEFKGPATGQIVVMVHGSTIPMYVWDQQVDDLVNAGFRVLRYDQYGKGFSDRPEGSYSQEFYRRQLLDLLSALKINNPVDLVRRLVLASPVINSIKNDTNIKLLRPPIWGEFLMRLVATNSLAKRAADLTAKSVKSTE